MKSICLFGYCGWISLVSIASVALPTNLAYASPSYQSQDIFDYSQNVEAENSFASEAVGFQVVHINNRGRVLETFVNIPGATIKVHAGGRVEIAEQNYSVEVDYSTGGRIRRIGNTGFYYFSSGRVRAIDDIRFNYFSNGRFNSIDNVDFNYFRSGRIRSIDNIRFDYNSLGMLETVTANQTANGVRIVVVD
ncbi:hypothetical protein PN498_18435 [Oscillatoria sp. CS-180]|uniref:hypothetical protein n=1 Tax=Oscillatoria sp. CS-180 TaxID=3021720 RepID=UPI00232B3EFF|nr:hypothetical protein [Oscillatoria sp. CS-180]MDB9527978.1 hypothetical protein [Oscillatoria sp. CS-180]